MSTVRTLGALRTTARRPWLLPVVLGLALTSARAEVLVVDPADSLGSGFGPLQTALAFAQDGDIILLRPGDYAPQPTEQYVIDGKGVTVVADTGAEITTLRWVVKNVPAGSTVVLRNLTLGPTEAGSGVASYLSVESCAGAVLVEDCSMFGIDGVGLPFLPFNIAGLPAAQVADSPAVTFRNCTFTAGGGGAAFINVVSMDIIDGAEGGPGLRATDSGVHLFDCVLIGGAGGAPLLRGYDAGGPGGAGLQLFGSDAFVMGGSLAPGHAGAGGAGANGGPGVDLDPRSAATFRDVGFVPGMGTGSGVDGQLTQPPGADVSNYPAPARSVTLGAPALGPGLVALEIDGEPGDLLLFAIAPGAGALDRPPQQGVLILDFEDYTLLENGFFLPTGDFSTSLGVPDLPAGTDGILILVQGLFFGARDVTLGSPTSFIWIDDAL